MTTADVLARRFADFARDCRSRSPLYGSVCDHLAESAVAIELLGAAPVTQQNPVLLLAAIHDLLLAEPDLALGRHYPSVAGKRSVFPGRLSSDLDDLLESHGDVLRALVRRRRVQTNEIGRCATFLPALGLLAAERGPLGLVDVGTSAGLTLLADRYSYVYSPGGAVEATIGDGRVVLPCSTRGPVPVPTVSPCITERVGLDLGPIDVHDDDEARWLEACVWPDQADRFERLRSAIEIGRATALDLVTGDAVDDLATTLDRVRASHPVVTNSWVLNYLTLERRRAYVDVLDALGEERDLSWLYAESPAETEGLPTPPSPTAGPGPGPEHLTVLTLVRWRDGRREVQRLATAHPHGYWLHWGE